MEYDDTARTTAVSASEGRMKDDVTGDKKKRKLLKVMIRNCKPHGSKKR